MFLGSLYRGVVLEDLSVAASLGGAFAAAGVILAIAIGALLIATSPRKPRGLAPLGAAARRPRAPGPALLAAATGGSLGVLAIGLYWRSGREAPRPAVLIVASLIAVICAVGAIERIFTLVRSHGESTRRKFEWNHSWLTALVLTASLVGFGVVGVFDTKRDNNVRAIVMLSIGVTVTVLTVQWFRKPTRPERNTQRVDLEVPPLQQPCDPGGETNGCTA